MLLEKLNIGQWCGSVGRILQFKSSYHAIFYIIWMYFTVSCQKDKNKEKEIKKFLKNKLFLGLVVIVFKFKHLDDPYSNPVNLGQP